MAIENRDDEKMIFPGEIDSANDVDLSEIANSMKSFESDASGTEEMENYENMQTTGIIHREGNKGVVADLEFLPEDGLDGDTRMFSKEDLVTLNAAGAAETVLSAENPAPEEDILEFASEYLGEDEPSFAEESYLAEDPVPDNEIFEENPLSEEEIGDLEDLTYHDEDVSEVRRKEAVRRRHEEEGRRHPSERERHSTERERHSGERERRSAEHERRAAEHERHGASRGEHRGEHVRGSEQQRPHAQHPKSAAHPGAERSENGAKNAQHKPADRNAQAHKSAHAAPAHPANHSPKAAGKPSASHGTKPSGGNGNHGSTHANRPPMKKKKQFSLFDGALIFGAVAAIFLVVILAIVATNKAKNLKKAETVALLGAKLAALETIGASGIDDIVANRKTTIIESVTEETAFSGNSGKDVSVNFTSIEKDLKIKFTDKLTGSLIKGVAFRVDATSPSKKQITWEDKDKDGIIYNENLESGIYKVKIASIGEYVFPDEEAEVTVKDKISYVAINVVDEVKKESEVNLAAEEPKGAEIDEGEKLQDTVAWVGSSQKEAYVEISKANDLPNIATLALATKRSMSAAAPSSASVSGDSSVEVGKTVTLSAKIIMDDNSEAAPSSVTWSSGDPEIATVTDAGVVEGKKAGTVTISCECKYSYTEEGSSTPTEVTKTATKEITVTEATTPAPEGVVKSLTLDNETVTVTIGTTATVKPKVTADEGVETGVIWNSMNESVATVADGVITGKTVGEAVITCTTKGKAEGGNPITRTVKVTVSEGSFVKELKLDKTAEILQINASVKITPTVTGTDDKVEKTVTWKSSNEAIATVAADGTVTAKAKGEAVITCTTTAKDKDGKALEATCKITVSNAMADTVTALKDKSSNQVYVKDGENYREAKYADYFKYSNFYIKKLIYTGWQTIGGKTMYFKADGNFVTGEQVIGGVKYNFASDGALSMGGGTLGIDVSRNNGTINWTAVKNAGVSFVIIRCGYRGYTQGGLIEDSNFHSYASGAEAAGLKVGVYFFSQAVNEREAVEEASMAVAMAKSHRISYPIFIDSEYANASHTGRADKLSKSQRTAVCRAFCETIRSAGYTPGVYASKYWYYDNLDAGALNNYKIWLAHYTTQTDYRGKYELWQKSCTGRINGISGNVDIDTSYLGY